MKKHLDDKIDDLLRSSLGNLQLPTTSEDWNAISKGLGKNKKKPFGWLKGLSILGVAYLLIFSGIFIGYRLYKNNTNASHQSVTINKKSGKNNTTSFQNNHIKLKGQIKTNGLENKKSTTSSSLHEPQRNSGLNVNHNTICNLNKYIKPIFNYSENNFLANNSSKKYSKPDQINNAIFQRDNYEFINSKKVTDNTTTENNAQNNMSHMNNIFAQIGEINNNPIDIEKNELQKKSINHNYIPIRKLPIYNRLNIEVGVSPNYNTITEQLKPNSEALIHEDYKNEINGQAKNGVGVVGGIKMDYRIWNNIAIHAGVQYNCITENVNYQYLVNKIPVTDSATGKILGYIDLPNPYKESYKGTNAYTFISIPLEFSYTLVLGGRIGLNVRAGMDMMFSTGASGQQVNPEDLQLTDLKTSTDLRKINYGYQFSAGIDYALTPRLKLEILPLYHKTINPLFINSSLINNAASSIGIQFGVKYGIL